ncbi:MAG TPA: FtsX-like permease family protein [Tepidisphaeraceae bacterium]|nr:FtsX-like permease family protein [Tepidisphaeraceae bacterium]
MQRQISLPMAKAVEIAYKNIRMRLSRSLLVTSGIVLALAFLMSILVNNAVIDALRRYAQTAPHSAQFQSLRDRAAQIDADNRALATQIGTAAHKPHAQTGSFDDAGAFGESLADLQKDLGTTLPAAPSDLDSALAANPALLAPMKKWVANARSVKAIRGSLAEPDQLLAIMTEQGVPTNATEIENSRIQTRWLLGLALLVAFVGILNAMLMSVTERFREIGTMKCLGALDSFIIKLFLLESLFQGTVGTVIGVIIGVILSILAAASSYGSFAWKEFPTGQIALAFLICLLVGIGLTVAGAVYPAWQAARMQPIEAMRVET